MTFRQAWSSRARLDLLPFHQSGLTFGSLGIYHLVICYIAMENPLYMEVLIGKSSINGPFSMAMLNNQRVIGRFCWAFFVLRAGKNGQFHRT